MLALLAALALIPSPPEVADAQPVEIVVQAVRDKCRVRLLDELLSPAELAARTEAWAGRPVRVIAPRGANYKCLARIVFKLHDKGVRLIQFVDRSDEP